MSGRRGGDRGTLATLGVLLALLATTEGRADYMIHEHLTPAQGETRSFEVVTAPVTEVRILWVNNAPASPCAVHLNWGGAPQAGPGEIEIPSGSLFQIAVPHGQSIAWIGLTGKGADNNAFLGMRWTRPTGDPIGKTYEAEKVPTPYGWGPLYTYGSIAAGQTFEAAATRVGSGNGLALLSWVGDPKNSLLACAYDETGPMWGSPVVPGAPGTIQTAFVRLIALPDGAPIPADLVLDVDYNPPCTPGQMTIQYARTSPRPGYPRGMRMRTRVFLPNGAGPWPALLKRSPYRASQSGYISPVYDTYGKIVPGVSIRRDLSDFMREGHYFAGLWFVGDDGISTTPRSPPLAYVFQDVRGTPMYPKFYNPEDRSEGALDQFAHEDVDGFDAVEWIIKQQWCNGDVGTMGGSYAGKTALAAGFHPNVKMVIAADASGDPSRPHEGTLNPQFMTWLAHIKGLVYGAPWGYPDAAGISEIVNDHNGLMGMDAKFAGLPDTALWGGQVANNHDANSDYWKSRWYIDPVKMQNFKAPLLCTKSTLHWNCPIDIWRSAIEYGCNGQGSPVKAHMRLALTWEGHGHHYQRFTRYVTDVTEISNLMDLYVDAFLLGYTVYKDWLTVTYPNRVLYRHDIRTQYPSVGDYTQAADWPVSTQSITFLLQGDGQVGSCLSYPGPGRLVTAGELVQSLVFSGGETWDPGDSTSIDPTTDPTSSAYPRLTFSREITSNLVINGNPQVVMPGVSISSDDADFAAQLFEYYDANYDGVFANVDLNRDGKIKNYDLNYNGKIDDHEREVELLLLNAASRRATFRNGFEAGMVAVIPGAPMQLDMEMGPVYYSVKPNPHAAGAAAQTQLVLQMMPNAGQRCENPNNGLPPATQHQLPSQPATYTYHQPVQLIVPHD